MLFAGSCNSPDQLKFVVDSVADAQEVLDYLQRLGNVDAQRVLLMPQGTEARGLDHQAEWLIPWCTQHNFRFCPRLAYSLVRKSTGNLRPPQD